MGWLMRLLVPPSSSPPRSYDEIKRAVDAREAEHLQRLNAVEESLLALTAEAGLEDLRRRIESISRD